MLATDRATSMLHLALWAFDALLLLLCKVLLAPSLVLAPREAAQQEEARDEEDGGHRRHQLQVEVVAHEEAVDRLHGRTHRSAGKWQLGQPLGERPGRSNAA